MPLSSAKRRATGDARTSCTGIGGASSFAGDGGGGMPAASATGASGAAGGSAAVSGSSSSCAPIIAMAWPTGTVVPSGTRILRNSPVAVDSTSTTALSVSISAIASPRVTAVSTDLSQRTTVPSCMS